MIYRIHTKSTQRAPRDVTFSSTPAGVRESFHRMWSASPDLTLAEVRDERGALVAGGWRVPVRDAIGFLETRVMVGPDGGVRT